jgi:hypothetical protein
MDLLKWINLVDERSEDYMEDVRFEQEIGISIRKNNEVSKNQILDIIDWKFSDKPHYIKRMKGIFEGVGDDEVREITKHSFQLTFDEYKLKLLCSIPGVGPMLASILLAYYDPYKYGIFDQHTWNQLYPEEPRNITVDGYLKVLGELRKMAQEYKVPVRIIDQALRIKDMSS